MSDACGQGNVSNALHWTRFVGHLLVNAGDHAMAD